MPIHFAQVISFCDPELVDKDLEKIDCLRYFIDRKLNREDAKAAKFLILYHLGAHLRALCVLAVPCLFLMLNP